MLYIGYIGIRHSLRGGGVMLYVGYIGIRHSLRGGGNAICWIYRYQAFSEGGG